MRKLFLTIAIGLFALNVNAQYKTKYLNHLVSKGYSLESIKYDNSIYTFNDILGHLRAMNGRKRIDVKVIKSTVYLAENEFDGLSTGYFWEYDIVNINGNDWVIRDGVAMRYDEKGRITRIETKNVSDNEIIELIKQIKR